MAEPSQSQAWITAARGGDRFALAKLLATCDPQLRARAEVRIDAAMRVKRGPDDLLQDTYLEAVRRIGQFKGCDLSSFLKWVAVILDHKLVDARRAAHCQARDVEREVRVEGVNSDSYWNLLDQVYAEWYTPSRVVARQEAVGALAACLSTLSGPQRRVVQMRFLEGISVADVAARLGKSEAAVAALTQRALKALRLRMDQLGEFTGGA
jgi:RNA polymerase sigma-70 factor (ECF subfamily)